MNNPNQNFPKNGRRPLRRPIPFEKVPVEALNVAARVFNAAKKLPDPPAPLIRQRMRELRELGFEDIPVVQGISSSVRQYAINSLACSMGHPGEEALFPTMDEQLLDGAEMLHKRYGLRPISMQEFFSRMNGGNT